MLIIQMTEMSFMTIVSHLCPIYFCSSIHSEVHGANLCYSRHLQKCKFTAATLVYTSINTGWQGDKDCFI